jgi:hypothetical protein
MPGLENLSDKDLELISEGNLEGLSDEALESLAGYEPGLRDAVAEQPQEPGLAQTLGRGVLGVEEQAGLTVPNIAEELGQAAGPIAGSIIGAGGGPPGIAAGAALGRGAQLGLQQAYAAGTGKGLIPQEEILGSAGQLVTGQIPEAIQIGKIGEEAIANLIGAKYISPGIGKVAGGLKKFAFTAYERASKVFSGIKPESIERLFARGGERVLSKISLAKESPGDYAEAFIGAIDANMDAAGKAYDNILGKAVRGKYVKMPFKFKGLTSKINSIKKKAGFEFEAAKEAGVKDVGAETLDAVARIAEKVKTGEGAYYTQKYINRLIRDSSGKEKASIRGALGRVLRIVQRDIGSKMPELKPANKIYRRAAQLTEKADKLIARKPGETGIPPKRDVPGIVAGIYRKRIPARKEVEEIARGIPDAADALEKMRDAIAGQAFEPLIGRSVLGILLASGGIGGTALGGSPAMLAGTAMASPRLMGLAGAGGAALQRAYGQLAGRVPAAVPQAIAGRGVSEAYQRLR